MTTTLPPEMTEATRLVRAGKLAEATTLIQRLLGGGHAKEGFFGHAMTLAGDNAAIPGVFAPTLKTAASAKSGEPVRSRTGLGKTLRKLAAIARIRDFDDAKNANLQPVTTPFPQGSSFTTASYANAAGARDYKLYSPSARAKAQAQMPLIVMLHGCTQSPDDFAAGTGMNLLAEEAGFMVAYPAQSKSANGKNCWNWFRPRDQRRDQGEPSIIAGITRQIIENYPVEPARVYIAGLSAGGAAAVVMAAEYPDIYAATGVHSGLPQGAARDVPSAFDAMRRGSARVSSKLKVTPAIVFHGDQDVTVHPRNSDAIVKQSTSAAPDLHAAIERGQAPGGRTFTRTVHTDVTGRALCEQWTIHGAGHAWSGGNAAGSYTDERGPDASREMLRFFLQHRLA
ncbi:MAG: PHB depolymerase family esterase [Hyphomicrobiales bacterium]|nr:PHB depolymerase family esterase [Hyphomicrobiales bacterium]